MSHSYAEIHKTKSPTKKVTDAEGKKSAAQEYYFIIKSAGNGETLATSEMYSSKQSALKGIAAVYTIKGNVYSKDQTKDMTGEKE